MNNHTATEPPQAKPAVGAQVDRGVRRLVARRDIAGPEWTFAKGRHLLGKRSASGTWTVWPRRAPTAYLIGVPDELVRDVEDAAAQKAAKQEREDMQAWCAPGQSVAEMLRLAAERDS